MRPVSLAMSTSMQRPGNQTIDIADLLIWAFREQQVESAPDPHADATTVYWAVMALPDPHARIVSHFARVGEVPDWHAGPDRVVRLETVRKARLVYAEWVRALVVLQRTLDGALIRYRVSGPRLEETPWRRGTRASG